MLRALAVVAVTAAVVAGTASSARATFDRHTIPGYGTSISLPASWKTVDYRQILEPGELERFARENPDLAGTFAAMAQPSSPIKLFAYDPQVANGFATNANVVIAPLRGPVALSEYARQLVGELANLRSVSKLHSSKVRLPAGQAVRLTYRLTINVHGRALSVQTLQYALLAGRRSVVVTYSTLPTSVRFYSTVFATSARSIRFS